MILVRYFIIPNSVLPSWLSWTVATLLPVLTCVGEMLNHLDSGRGTYMKLMLALPQKSCPAAFNPRLSKSRECRQASVMSYITISQVSISIRAEVVKADEGLSNHHQNAWLLVFSYWGGRCSRNETKIAFLQYYGSSSLWAPRNACRGSTHFSLAVLQSSRLEWCC